MELYNLSEDIEERREISEEYPDKVAELREEMHTYIQARDGKYPDRLNSIKNLK